jgi:hypothetical protein
MRRFGVLFNPRSPIHASEFKKPKSEDLIYPIAPRVLTGEVCSGRTECALVRHLVIVLRFAFGICATFLRLIFCVILCIVATQLSPTTIRFSYGSRRRPRAHAEAMLVSTPAIKPGTKNQTRSDRFCLRSSRYSAPLALRNTRLFFESKPPVETIPNSGHHRVRSSGETNMCGVV